MGIHKRAMLVTLNISTWGTERKDKQQAERLAQLNNANSMAVRVEKDIMAGTTLASEINKYAAKVRTWNNKVTLPWEDQGARLLPMTYFFDWKEEMKKHEAHFDKLVNTLVPRFASEIQIAMQELGAMANPDLYPDPSEIAARYKFKYRCKPVPASGHFCLDANNAEVKDVMEACDAEVQDQLAEAMKKPWEKLHSLLLHMSDKLAATDDDDAPKKRIHSTFVDNAQELCDLLKHMNITGDPELEGARKQLEITLLSADVEELKAYDYQRENMKTKVDKILGQFDW